MKKFLLYIPLCLIFAACTETTVNDTDLFDPEIRFHVSSRLATGENISCLFVSDENNYFYATGNKVIHVENSQPVITEISSDVLAIAWNDKTESLWFGTKSSGLGQLKEGRITCYNQKDYGLPRDLVYELVCDHDGAVWFSSCAHQLGGLGCYSGGNFSFYTPENSSLPDNLIKSISCRGQKIYVATGGFVTQQKVLVIEGKNWKTLPVEGYYLMDMDVDQNGNVYVIDDTGLSSTIMPNKIYQYKNEKCRNILPQESSFYPHPYCIRTDLRNYLWVAQFTSGGKGNLAVYDGKKWSESPDDFPDLYVKCISVDSKNNIWLGTSTGIYILNQ